LSFAGLFFPFLPEREKDKKNPENPAAPREIYGSNSEAYLTGEVQLVNYLNGLKKEIGLFINFGPTGVDVKGKYRKNIGQD